MKNKSKKQFPSTIHVVRLTEDDISMLIVLEDTDRAEHGELVATYERTAIGEKVVTHAVYPTRGLKPKAKKRSAR